MTSSPPSEAPYFGKSLTPESPIPLHIPEPSNIPILQNQIDPIFNQMSTHMEQHLGPRNTVLSTTQHAFTGLTYTPEGFTDGDTMLVHGGGLQDDNRSKGDGDSGYVTLQGIAGLQQQQQSKDALQNLSPSPVLQPTSSVVAFDNTSPALPPSQNQTISEEPTHQTLDPFEPPQDASMTQGSHIIGHDPPDERNNIVQSTDTDVNGGVNYQTLLDNLSPSTATAPSADNIPSITTAAPSDAASVPRSSSVDSPIGALPIPAGLPPRPPPQEKPAIHPNYTPGEDIRSYHYPHTQTSNSHSSYSSQPSNSYRSSQGYHHSVSGPAVGANGLPPPPLATFQQPTQNAGPTQQSPLTSLSRQKDSLARKGENVTLSASEEEDEVPWSPDIERKYAQFLHDEAIYVTEGLWDRFPPGSRLFVGKITPVARQLWVLLTGAPR